MKIMRFNVVLMVVTMAMMIVGCKPSIPDYVIPPDKMEDILYDYHLAQGAAVQDFKDANFKRSLYGKAVLKKYGITEADFDTSMVYYMANTAYLHDIYKSLSEKFTRQAESMGSTAGLVTIENASDTASIWSGAKTVLLLPQAPYNRLSFEMTADSTFYPGDKIIVNFDTKFLWQEGMKDGAMLLAMRFGNDSVASRIVHISNSSHFNISINDANHKGIKSINGFFYISTGSVETQPNTTLKLLFIDNISIIRMHEPKPEASANPDSLKRIQDPGGPNDTTRNRPNANMPASSDSMRRNQSVRQGGLQQLKIN